jgi:hypothetical protein
VVVILAVASSSIFAACQYFRRMYEYSIFRPEIRRVRKRMVCVQTGTGSGLRIGHGMRKVLVPMSGPIGNTVFQDIREGGLGQETEGEKSCFKGPERMIDSKGSLVLERILFCSFTV